MNDLVRLNSPFMSGHPSAQNAIDIFRGEWSSQLPPPLNTVVAGRAALFDDERIKWLVAELGGLQGQHILELGPLEGGHSYMLDRCGAESIVAIESNTRAYLKCLITKELLGLQRVQFLCGDFIEYLRSSECPDFDVGVASGVLYHMVNPVELVALLARRCKAHLFLWTHYYDRALIDARNLLSRFVSSERVTYGGFEHSLFRQDYGDEALGWSGFCGGSQSHSHWLLRQEITRSLKYFGFSRIKINFEDPDHPNGPAFALLASLG
jgi:hypothetical protein